MQTYKDGEHVIYNGQLYVIRDPVTIPVEQKTIGHEMIKEDGEMMKKLSTIQKRENLNRVYRLGEEGPGGAFHDYGVLLNGEALNSEEDPTVLIEFQRGPRKDPDSRHGVLDCDLLEIVRDRLKSFQAGDFACRENACALTCIEEALMWLNKRVEDRIERNVLGTMEK